MVNIERFKHIMRWLKFDKHTTIDQRGKQVTICL